MKRTLLSVFTLAFVTAFSSACSMNTTAQLPEKIKSEVSRLSPPLKGYSLEVTARSEGAVELTGYVASEADKQRLIEVAKRVDGVQTVDEKVSVKGAPRGDGENESKFQSAIFQKLEDELVGAQYLVSIVDRGGDVVVQGSTDSLVTKGRILEAVRSVVGTQARVIDELKQATSPSDRWIYDQVSSELRKRFPEWIDKVSVTTVRNGVVTLAGSLGDHWDIDLVLAAVVMVPGVKDLNNAITINGKPYSSDGVRKTAR
jgi:osmotically-inducible protein OsmY